MSEWLSKLHEFYTDGAPFVIGTVTSFSGSSPDRAGACVFYSEKQTTCFIHSESRRNKMLATCQAVLRSGEVLQIEKQSLGDISGSENGHCVIVYEYFEASQYPQWLQQLRNNLQAGINTVWLREFNKSTDLVEDKIITEQTEDNTIESVEFAAQSFAEKNQSSNCLLIDKDNSTVLLRAVNHTDIPLVLIGSHSVCIEIEALIKRLPIKLTKIDSTDKNWVEKLPAQSYVIIMTSDHELDYYFCNSALNQPKIKFLGCIGSEKKAKLFKTRLISQGITEQQLKKLTMPVGLPQIDGKQTSVVATSIIAQIMSLHQW